MARLLNLYQLWLDDLFPKAKFADGLAMIEKLGHSKRIQVMRREWINQGKPRNIWEQDQREELTSREVGQKAALEPSSLAPPTGSGDGGVDLSSLESTRGNSANRELVDKQQGRREADLRKDESLFVTDDEKSQPEDDELDALLAEGTLDQPVPQSNDQGQPDDDELDALMAEDVELRPIPKPGSQLREKSRPDPPRDDEFADEMEAMAGMDDMW